MRSTLIVLTANAFCRILKCTATVSAILFDACEEAAVERVSVAAPPAVQGRRATKKAARKSEADLSVLSFQSLFAELATFIRNTIVLLLPR